MSEINAIIDPIICVLYLLVAFTELALSSRDSDAKNTSDGRGGEGRTLAHKNMKSRNKLTSKITTCKQAQCENSLIFFRIISIIIHN